jgi:hypothetical protein
MNADAIGGYLELELPRAGAGPHPDALAFQSARAAFRALLEAGRPSAVWIPRYQCGSLLEPLAATGTPVRRYDLDAQLRVKDVPLADGEWLLYVNYFGLCDANVSDVLARFPSGQVVIDNAQALFAAPRACRATLYSPRKFVGVPDGGYLATDHAVAPPAEIDTRSAQRFAHLVERIDAGAEAGYASYVRAEESLSNEPPRRMSALTRRLLAGIDYADVRARRRANFDYLHARLGHANAFPLTAGEHAVPLCYPFLGAPDTRRAELFKNRIYTPCYWPEVAADPALPDVERSLAQSTLFLPCDQRLTSDRLDALAARVLAA